MSHVRRRAVTLVLVVLVVVVIVASSTCARLICPGGPRCRALYDFRLYFSMPFRFFRAHREAGRATVSSCPFLIPRRAKQTRNRRSDGFIDDVPYGHRFSCILYYFIKYYYAPRKRKTIHKHRFDVPLAVFVLFQVNVQATFFLKVPFFAQCSPNVKYRNNKKS